MAGLVPATHAFLLPPLGRSAKLATMGGWVYIVTNRPNGTLYVGATADLARRMWEHREGVAAGFTKQYHLKRLVYAERFSQQNSVKPTSNIGRVRGRFV